MTKRDEDRADLDASRAAVEAARTASIQTSAAVAVLHEARDRIQNVIEPNGYVSRFREILRGA